MPKPTDYDKTHLRNMAAIGTRIDRIFKKAAEEAAKIGVSIKTALPEDRIFSFDDYPATLKQIERLMAALQESMETTIVNGVRSAWTLSNNKNNALVSRIFGDRVGNLSKEQYRRYFSTNGAALDAFLQRKEKGLNLSDRVWRYTDAFKREIELGLDLGIRTGESAAQMSRSLRQYLQHPDKLFRRVRDKHGNLNLSKAARDYHPGRGVYRSSYKNARRLACTETNIAYRTSDHLRWQQMEFVVGIEIKLSNNHTLNGVPLTDICDTLAGRYPKDFKFTGWHPHCRCHVVTVLKTEEEMAEDTQRILAGEQPKKGSVNEVRHAPTAFSKWVEDNKERIEAAEKRGTLPYFIKDNRKMMNGILEGFSKTDVSTGASTIVTNPVTNNEQSPLKKNHQELAKALGIEQGNPMTFEEANEMRGNPNYKKGVKYRVNCQCSVLANEMRRRGFDVEAFGNTKEDWYMPSVLAKKPEVAFISVNGQPPVAIGIKFNGDLLRSLEGEMKEPGRYHLRFRFQNDGGHIITAERLPDGSLRIYDPQSGKIIRNFSEYSTGVKTDSFEYYRVDNMRINADVAKGAVKPAKSKGDAPRMQMPQITEFLEKGWYGEEDYYSPKVQSVLKSLRDRKSKDQYLNSLLSNEEFTPEYVADNGSRTILHPGHKIKDAYWPKTKEMAHALNKDGRDVVFLPEHDNTTMADALTKFKGIPRIVDFKYSASTKSNTLQQHLAEAFNQASAVVLKLENMDTGQFRETIEYMKRNDLPLGDVILINARNKVKELTLDELRSGKYLKKIRGYLK